MDWSDCRLVESIPEKLSGAPVIKGTRIFADTIPENYELGMSIEEIHESYPSLALQDIEELIKHPFDRKPQLRS